MPNGQTAAHVSADDSRRPIAHDGGSMRTAEPVLAPGSSVSDSRSHRLPRASYLTSEPSPTARRATCLRPTAPSGLNLTVPPRRPIDSSDRCVSWLWENLVACADRAAVAVGASVPPVSAAALGSRPLSCTAGLAALTAAVLRQRWARTDRAAR